MTERRVYPYACLSAFCGRIECEGCRYKPMLDEFKAWVEETGAKPADHIWSPNVYVVPEQGRKCTECGAMYSDEPAGELGELKVSHGVCPECAAEWEARLEREMRDDSA